MSRPMNFWEFLDENGGGIAFVICFLAFLLFLFFMPVDKPVHRMNNSAVISNEKLNSWYRGYNEEYFANQLPKNTVVKLGDLTPQDDIGMSQILPNGNWIIIIDRAKNPSPVQARMTLLHESCHVRTYIRGMAEFEVHGDKFQACMLQLAHQGAFKELW